MIPFIIYLLIKERRYKNRVHTFLQIHKFWSIRFKIVFTGLLLVLLTFLPVLLKSQNLHLKYKIVQGGDDIGWLQLEKTVKGDSTSLLLTSEIKKRIIFQITVSAKESSVYKNGKLTYSSQFRETNGDTKLNKQTRLIEDKYVVMEDGENENLAFSYIGTNLLSLYFQEPTGISAVYSDNHKCFIKLYKTDDGGYKVKFPDGNSNCYYYRNGICTKIIVSHTFYSAAIIINP